MPKQQSEKRAWVVFTNQSDLFWVRFLKKGFRHCFILIHDGTHWISIDPMASMTDIAIHTVPKDFDLPNWLAGQGHRVTSAPLRNVQTPAPWMMFTCVEACKRILGIHNRFILTPWQLYKYLKGQNSDV